MSSFSTPIHPFRYPFHFLRTLIIQPLFWVVFVLSPVLRWFQLDMLNEKFIFMGHIYPFQPSTVGWFPIGFFVFVLLVGFICTIWGRLFCGWVCPHNTMTEWLRPVRMLIGIGKKPFFIQHWEKQWPWMRAVHIGVSLAWGAAITFALGTLIIFYFVPIPWYMHHLNAGTMPVIVWLATGLLMLIGYFLLYSGHQFCAFGCPYGMLQSLSAYMTQKWTPMEIRYKFGSDLSPCKGCHACEVACPVEIDPRSPENLIVGESPGCFNCGECIDACNYIHSAKNQPGYLRFRTPFEGQDGLSALMAKPASERD